MKEGGLAGDALRLSATANTTTTGSATLSLSLSLSRSRALLCVSHVRVFSHILSSLDGIIALVAYYGTA